MNGYHNLPPTSAVTLVRAARLFQRGLWLCESNPNDAWLMFVSSIEVAAVEWRKADDDPESLFRDLKPEWAKRLEKDGGNSLVRDMALEWVDLIRPTNRFIKFILEHIPEPPPIRPPSYVVVDWTKKGLKSILQKVYEYRSKALHAGIPFPIPMCEPPTVFPDFNAPSEHPLGLASATKDGIWTAEDLPIHLHIFEYIVREAFLKWWNSIRSENGNSHAH